MKNQPKPLVLVILLIMFSVINSHASGGKFWQYEKMDHNISLSYTFITPTGHYITSGREGDKAKWGQGFELEYMHYWELDYSDNWRIGVGGSIPFYFIPINSNAINPQLTTAFAADNFSNTSFISPKHNQWFGVGLGAEASIQYAINRFSVEATLKIGDMNVYSPNYKLVGGSYVPPDFVQYFPYEGGRRHGNSAYVNFGLQTTLFLTENFAIFGGMGVQYLNPSFKKDLTYVRMVNGEPTIERQQFKVREQLSFFQFRFGITINIPED